MFASLSNELYIKLLRLAELELVIKLKNKHLYKKL